MVRIAGIVIVVLAIVDGLVHLGLDAFVVHFSRGPYNVLFALNFVGYAALVVLFLLTQQSSFSIRRLLDVVLIVYPLVTFAAWIYFTKGRGNPMDLAYISKPAEIIIAIAALVHLTQLGHESATGVASAQA